MIRVKGPWKKGYAFDIHTIESIYTGDNEFGHPTFDIGLWTVDGGRTKSTD